MTILQIGAGGVGWVVAHKCVQHNDILGDLVIASRRAGPAQEIVDDIRSRGDIADPNRSIQVQQLDAHDVGSLVALINASGAELVINVGPPWIDLDVMRACLETRAHYIDTAIAVDLFSEGQLVPNAYDQQWAFRERFAEEGITGILGAGFDPGIVSAYATYIQQHFVDEIETIDVLDVNAGDHGRFFATNFDAETNLLEIQGDSFRWEDGEWKRSGCHSRSITMDLPEVGKRTLYSMAHDEVRSLAEFVPARRIEFWMGFTDRYLDTFRTLREIGLLSPEPVTTTSGASVSPLNLLKAVLPDPKSLARGYRGKTFIGTLVAGSKDGAQRAVLAYNICDHEAAYADVGSQAIAYTAGVPAVAAAMAQLEEKWAGPGLHNIEQLDPVPFLSRAADLGLPWQVVDLDPASLPQPA